MTGRPLDGEKGALVGMKFAMSDLRDFVRRQIDLVTWAWLSSHENYLLRFWLWITTSVQYPSYSWVFNSSHYSCVHARCCHHTLRKVDDPLHVQFGRKMTLNSPAGLSNDLPSPIACHPSVKWRKRISWSSRAYEYYPGRHSRRATTWHTTTWSYCSSKSLNAQLYHISPL